MAREVAYAVSKGALLQATLTLADELADRGITVNTINPGPTDTGWGLADEDPSSSMPFGRWGEPDDAARPRRLAVHRRCALDHRSDDRLGRRLPALEEQVIRRRTAARRRLRRRRRADEMPSTTSGPGLRNQCGSVLWGNALRPERRRLEPLPRGVDASGRRRGGRAIARGRLAPPRGLVLGMNRPNAVVTGVASRRYRLCDCTAHHVSAGEAVTSDAWRFSPLVRTWEGLAHLRLPSHAS
jgi:enoyl-ACP reductase-like protein